MSGLEGEETENPRRRGVPSLEDSSCKPETGVDLQDRPKVYAQTLHNLIIQQFLQYHLIYVVYPHLCIYNY